MSGSPATQKPALLFPGPRTRKVGWMQGTGSKAVGDMLGEPQASATPGTSSQRNRPTRGNTERASGYPGVSSMLLTLLRLSPKDGLASRDQPGHWIVDSDPEGRGYLYHGGFVFFSFNNEKLLIFSFQWFFFLTS